MSEELFPAAAITADSPRLAWMKRHGLKTWPTRGWVGDTTCPETGADIRQWNAARDGHEPGMIHAPVCSADTEDEALAELALKLGLKLWNEETS